MGINRNRKIRLIFAAVMVLLAVAGFAIALAYYP
jgi:ABC-type transporter Mla subunit MlaD